MKQELEKVIADFESATGYGLEIRDGRPYYRDYLDLESCTGITSLPEGLTVGGCLYLRGTGITSLPDGLTVGGLTTPRPAFAREVLAGAAAGLVCDVVVDAGGSDALAEPTPNMGKTPRCAAAAPAA